MRTKNVSVLYSLAATYANGESLLNIASTCALQLSTHLQFVKNIHLFQIVADYLLGRYIHQNKHISVDTAQSWRLQTMAISPEKWKTAALHNIIQNATQNVMHNNTMQHKAQ